MEFPQLMTHINRVTDEDFELYDMLGFINDAIQKINIEVGAIFPEIDETLPEKLYEQEEYVAIPDKWIRMLIVPFAAGRIKENDSSQFEYIDWYSQFDLNLERFKTDYKIPEEFIDPSSAGGRYEDDFSTNIFNPMKGW